MGILLIVSIIIIVILLIICYQNNPFSYFQIEHKSCSHVTLSDFADEVFPPHVTSSEIHSVTHMQDSEGAIFIPLQRKGDLIISAITNFPLDEAWLTSGDMGQYSITKLRVGKGTNQSYINLNYLPIIMLPNERLFVKVYNKSNTAPQVSYRTAEVDDKCSDIMAERKISISWRPKINGDNFYIIGGRILTKES